MDGLRHGRLMSNQMPPGTNLLMDFFVFSHPLAKPPKRCSSGEFIVSRYEHAPHRSCSCMDWIRRLRARSGRVRRSIFTVFCPIRAGALRATLRFCAPCGRPGGPRGARNADRRLFPCLSTVYTGLVLLRAFALHLFFPLPPASGTPHTTTQSRTPSPRRRPSPASTTPAGSGIPATTPPA